MVLRPKIEKNVNVKIWKSKIFIALRQRCRKVGLAYAWHLWFKCEPNMNQLVGLFHSFCTLYQRIAFENLKRWNRSIIAGTMKSSSQKSVPFPKCVFNIMWFIYTFLFLFRFSTNFYSNLNPFQCFKNVKIWGIKDVNVDKYDHSTCFDCEVIFF